MAESTTNPIQQKVDKLKREGEERATERLSKELGIPYLDLGRSPVSIEAVKLVSEEQAKKAKLVAIALRGKQVALVVSDPRTEETKKVIKELEALKHEVKLFIGSLTGIKETWHFYQFLSKKSEDEITGAVDIQKERFEEFTKKWLSLEDFKKDLEGSGLVGINTTETLEVILAEAIALRASDVHFEAEEEKSRVRFRIDGVLHDGINNLPFKNYNNLEFFNFYFKFTCKFSNLYFHCDLLTKIF